MPVHNEPNRSNNPHEHHLAQFISYLQIRGYSPDTIQKREADLKRFIGWCQQRGITDFKLISRPVLESYQRHLFHHRKDNGEPLAMATQRGRLTAIKTFFKWMARENHILYNPAQEIELPKQQQRLPRAILTPEEIQHLFSMPDTLLPQGVRDRAILEVLYATGMRRKELAHLKVQDIDFKARTVFVRQGKGGFQRLIPISGRALQWTERYLYTIRSLFVTGLDDHTLFLTDYGEPYINTRLSHLVKKYLKQAGIDKDGAAHLLRHALATHMLNNGVELRYIQEMLGHQQMNTTQIYTRVAIGKLQEVYERAYSIGML